MPGFAREGNPLRVPFDHIAAAIRVDRRTHPLRNA
jgi:hypothetical protein